MTSEEQQESRAAAIPDLTVNPIYQDFVYNFDEEYIRVHVHLVGVVSSDDFSGKAIGKRRNRFGRPRLVDAIADPYVTVKVLGRQADESTGSTDYFSIGKHKFSTLKDCRTPIWDSKCLLLSKKDALNGIQFTLWDDNGSRADHEQLMTVTVPLDELPEPTPLAASSWTTYLKQKDNATDSENASRTEHAMLQFSLMLTDGRERIASKLDMESLCAPETGYEYSQFVLPDATTEDPHDNALLQCWKHADSTRAVLWVLGRNDCFMHPHVARDLFFDNGYDLYVLNYKMNGQCRKCGWVNDPHYNAHNYSGDFDVYIADIQQSLQHIEATKEYDQVLGYAHSTGGPVLLNYLMAIGDAAFDGFVFNSRKKLHCLVLPSFVAFRYRISCSSSFRSLFFLRQHKLNDTLLSAFLDWGWVGGDMVEFVLENTGFLETFAGMGLGSKVGVAKTPPGQEPVMYLGQEIVPCDWSARLWSLYYFPWGSRPLYRVPMTVGFAKGVTAVHEKLRAFAKSKRPVTAKPFLCITSRGDDVLKAPETLSRADWIGPGRWEIELNDNGHDIFLSYDKSDTDMAISMCLTWLKNRKFA